MRSAIKIILGSSLILALILFIADFILAVTCFIHPDAYLATLTDLDVNTIYIVGGILFILSFLCLISLFIDNHAIKMMNEAYKKTELIPSIVLLFATLNIIPALLMIFTPSKRLISTHPYFE